MAAPWHAAGACQWLAKCSERMLCWYCSFRDTEGSFLSVHRAQSLGLRKVIVNGWGINGAASGFAPGVPVLNSAAVTRS
jgi:hypothetical protein